MAQNQFDSDIGQLNNVIERLESSLKHSFMHSTPKSDKIKSTITQSEKDSGVASGVDMSSEENVLSRDTVVFRTEKPKVRFVDSLPSKSDSFSEKDTLPLSANKQILKSDNSCAEKRERNVNTKNEITDIDKQCRNSEPHNQGVKCKPATYDGISSWIDYKSHFDMVALVNNWTENQKGLYLAVSLRGQAQAVLGDLPTDVRSNFVTLVNALEERFAPTSQTELYRVQFRERKQKASETLPEMGQAVRRLSNLAYPTAPREVRETLAKDQFIDGLFDSEMRLKIKQSRPINLDEAIRLAVELEAFNQAESSNRVNRGHLRSTNQSENIDSTDINSRAHTGAMEKIEMSMKTMEGMIKTLQSELEQMKSAGNSFDNKRWVTNNKRNKGCFNCGKLGHFQAECRSPSRRDTTRRLHTNRGQNHNAKSRVSIIEDAGMYVDTILNKRSCKFLVDTGATLSIVSFKLYESLPKHCKVELYETSQNITSANGGLLTLYGKGYFSIQIGKETFKFEALVADIKAEGILGLDFLKANKCVLDVVSERLFLGESEIQLIFEGPLGCYRVVSSETVSIPPSSEVVVNGKVCFPGGYNLNSFEGVIEPSENSAKNDGPLIARTLVKVNECVPVRLLNMKQDSQVVYQGSTIGQVHKIESVCENTHSDLKNKQSFELRSDLKALYEKACENLDEQQSDQLKVLIRKYEGLFAESDKELGHTNLVKHRINTGNAQPVKEPPRRAPVHLRQEVDKNIDDMLKKGVIEPSNSPWASGVVLVKKKDGSYRFCVDYRRLNKVTVKDAYPLPRIDDSLEQLAGSAWFSTLDLCSGYWQVEMHPDDSYKTAFATRRGLFQFKVMPFGLCCAPSTFERLMETVLAGLQWDICLVYLDDVIVAGKTFSDMLVNLDRVFERLGSAGLKLKAKKCSLCAKEVLFLGHVISEKGIATDPSKIDVVKNWPIPSNVTEIRSFLGLCSYYRRYIQNFASIARCLHVLTEKGKPYIWSVKCQESFDILKNHLIKAPILAHPEFTKDFILDTDASNESIGAVLSQLNDQGSEVVIGYASRTLSKAERRYCVTRKELLAVVNFVKHYKHYLYGRRFVVRTDHGSLRWLMQFKNPEGQLARWLEVLSEYEIQMVHRPGVQHRNADALSRIPCKQCGYFSNWDETHEKTEASVCVLTDTSDEYKDDQSHLEELQNNDKDLLYIKNCLRNQRRPMFSEVSGKGFVVRSLWSQWENLQLEDEILIRNYESEKEKNRRQVVLPFTERRNVLQRCHDDKTSGHLGTRKTLEKIRLTFYWPGLQSDVRLYIRGCDFCSRKKRPIPTKRAPMGIVQSSFPMERIATDILGELPETKNGNKYILVVSDYFSKWTESFPMPNMEAETVVKLIVEEVITRFGMPAYIHSDQGRQYESNLFHEMCRVLNIKKTRTTPYHPQSDGMVEKFNGTLAKMLSAYVNDNHDDWDEYLPYVMMAYRSAEHETTGYTPNYLMFGREVSTPLDIMYEMPQAQKEIPTNKWAWKMKERMESAHSIVRRNTETAMRRQKRYHDLKLSWQKFEKDDEVYVYFPVRKSGRSPKFTSFWRGPYKIIDQCTEVTYRVNCAYRGKEQVIHVDRIRKKNMQRLRDEAIESENGRERETVNDVCSTEGWGNMQNEEEIVTSDLGTKCLEESSHEPEKRRRCKPVWMKDYCVD